MKPGPGLILAGKKTDKGSRPGKTRYHVAKGGSVIGPIPLFMESSIVEAIVLSLFKGSFVTDAISLPLSAFLTNTFFFFGSDSVYVSLPLPVSLLALIVSVSLPLSSSKTQLRTKRLPFLG